jgi:hypothetical protein
MLSCSTITMHVERSLRAELPKPRSWRGGRGLLPPVRFRVGGHSIARKHSQVVLMHRENSSTARAVPSELMATLKVAQLLHHPTHTWATAWPEAALAAVACLSQVTPSTRHFTE